MRLNHVFSIFTEASYSNYMLQCVLSYLRVGHCIELLHSVLQCKVLVLVIRI